MNRHKKIHTGEKPFSCTKCEYKCIQKSGLDYHIKRKHGQSKEEEPKPDLSQTNMEAIKLKNGKWKCPCCSYSNKRIGDVKIHIKKEHLGNN